MFKVMFVDDEILAIQHMIHLIAWEQHGFQVVCHSTNPRKALELAAEHQPDVLFVDIKMPVMDGLVFCKAILSTGYKGKLVLLTSVKQFEYAKEALKLGVFNYLVKHELNADILLQELMNIKDHLAKERQQQVLVSRQLFADLLLDRKLSSNGRELKDLLSLSATKQYYLMVVQREEPFPVLANSIQLPSILDEAEQVRSLQAEIALTGSLILEVVMIEEHRLGIILACDRSNSERVTWQWQQNAALKMRSAFSKMAIITVLTGTVREIEQLADCYRDANALLNKAVFFTDRQLVHIDDYNRMILKLGQDPISQPVPSHYCKQIAARLKSHDVEDANVILNNWFTAVRATMSVSVLTDACRELASLINTVRAEYRLPPIEEWLLKKDSNLNEWIHIEGIRNWFADMLQATIEDRSARPVYSRKVQQAFDYINHHYAEEMTADTIAEQLLISSDHLRHLFKEETGQTVLDTLTAIRIHNAKLLLDEGNYKIYEIAARVGYRSSQYFSQVFRKMTGLNPNEYAERPQGESR